MSRKRLMALPVLNEDEALAILDALECEIPTRHAAAHNDLGERCDVPQGQGAVDDVVPAMERALKTVQGALRTPWPQPEPGVKFQVELTAPPQPPTDTGEGDRG